MGCWNKTCGLSKLHIYYGDPVLVFPLQENLDKTDRCYTTSFWKPVLAPFYSTYNDYGAGENSHGIALQLMIDDLKEVMIEKEQGENQYHDIAVKADQMSEELFFEAVHEGRLYVKSHTGDAMVDYVMFRKDIVDYITANHAFEMYVGDGNGTHGWGKAYRSYTYQDIINSVPEFIYLFKAALKRDSMYAFSRSHRSLFHDGVNQNLASEFLDSSQDYRYSGIFDATDALVNLLVAGNDEAAKELVETIVLGSFLDRFMHAHRITWAPGGHEGSQANEQDAYRTMCAAITAALDKESKERGDEELDDEDLNSEELDAESATGNN